MPKKSKQKKSLINWFLRANLALFLFLFAGYLAIIFSLDPNFLKRDFQDKYGQIKGVNVNVLVVGDPAKPVVQLTSGCNGTNAYINLSWSPDPLVDSFKIMRNGELLEVGLTDSEYVDESLLPGTYQYAVIAVGTNSTEVISDLAEKSVEICVVSVPTHEDEEDHKKKKNPTCKIETIDGVALKIFPGVFKTNNQRPIFSGHTNMEKAKIRIEIIGKTGIFAEIRANKNGFWQWQPPLDLALGTYEIKVKAIDFKDASRYKSDSVIFNITSREEAGGGIKEIIPSKGLPFDFEMEVQNPDKTVYAGEELDLKSTITQITKFDPQNEFLRYEILDSSGNKLIEIYDPVNISGSQEIYKKIDLSKLLKTGKYKVVVKTSYKNISIFSEDEFYLKEKPIFCFSSGVEITLTDILSGLGWLILLLLALLLVFLLLLTLEHRLAKEAKIQITEEIFENEGFLGKGKEVGR